MLQILVKDLLFNWMFVMTPSQDLSGDVFNDLLKTGVINFFLGIIHATIHVISSMCAFSAMQAKCVPTPF